MKVNATLLVEEGKLIISLELPDLDQTKIMVEFNGATETITIHANKAEEVTQVV